MFCIPGVSSSRSLTCEIYSPQRRGSRKCKTGWTAASRSTGGNRWRCTGCGYRPNTESPLESLHVSWMTAINALNKTIPRHQHLGYILFSVWFIKSSLLEWLKLSLDTTFRLPGMIVSLNAISSFIRKHVLIPKVNSASRVNIYFVHWTAYIILTI